MITKPFIDNLDPLRFMRLSRYSVIMFLILLGGHGFVDFISADDFSSGLASPPTSGTTAPFPPSLLPNTQYALPTPPALSQTLDDVTAPHPAPIPLATQTQNPSGRQNASSAMLGSPVQNQSLNLTPQQMATMQLLGEHAAGKTATPVQPHPCNQGFSQFQGYQTHPAYSQIYPAAQGHNPYLAGYGFSPYPQYNPIYNNDPYGLMDEEEDEEEGIPPNRYANPSSFATSPYMPVRSPLLETTWTTLGLMNPFNAPRGIHRNVGQPLEGESWLDHPYYVGVFGGWVSGGTLVEDIIEQGSGGNAGIMFGRHFNHYWGYEVRLFGTSVDIEDIEGNSYGSSKLSVLDFSMHYYPYGEARWRPYLKLGIGTARQKFLDQTNNTWSIPVGIGVKYFWSDRVSIHADIVDNVIFGKNRTKTNGELSFNIGVSYMFGTNTYRHPTIYWPHTPSKPY